MFTGICLCGSELDENGRCPREEMEYFERLQAAPGVNYVQERARARSQAILDGSVIFVSSYLVPSQTVGNVTTWACSECGKYPCECDDE